MSRALTTIVRLDQKLSLKTDSVSVETRSRIAVTFKAGFITLTAAVPEHVSLGQVKELDINFQTRNTLGLANIVVAEKKLTA